MVKLHGYRPEFCLLCYQNYSKSFTSMSATDYTDDEIEDVFYAEELQKVHKTDDIYKIERL